MLILVDIIDCAFDASQKKNTAQLSAVAKDFLVSHKRPVMRMGFLLHAGQAYGFEVTLMR